MADKPTGGLKAVEEAAIGSLPGIADLYDDTLLPVEQQGEARHMTGRQWKRYAQAGVSQYVEDAKEAADKALEAVNKVGSAVEDARASAADAKKSAESAKQYSGKPPIIQGGTWWTWNAERQEYADTGEAARGNVMYAVFFVDAGTGELYMVTDEEYTGPGFRLRDGDLEVVLNYGG